MSRAGRLSRSSLWLGLLFLYLPLVVLVIFSFNSSRLVTVWAGFSSRWYVELLHDQQLIDALMLSLRVAFMTATAATILGLMAGAALARTGRFHGRSLLAAMLIGPLVIPEVIMGLSMLLLFIALGQLIGWPAERGALTIWIAHVTFCTAYVAAIMTGRLSALDRSQQEAAMDLGATPVRVFQSITLPAIAPALTAGWLLSFTLSFDDLVIASFVTGPGASTLPIVIFSSVRLGVSPKVNALAALLIVAVTAVTLGGWWVSHRLAQHRTD
ncbi:MAG TPA: ABC transporter permease subunit [Chromatiales bacterium]|nr:ABC transporter permease subunit [Chromatiales bacterium]